MGYDSACTDVIFSMPLYKLIMSASYYCRALAFRFEGVASLTFQSTGVRRLRPSIHAAALITHPGLAFIFGGVAVLSLQNTEV